ncbi:hypothetical protein [Microbacterium maritypicum]|uniref:hypothetical protein n=1 Tax=Microbacterium maritypicum TaxID=33918 RepID=UPI003D756E31
MIFDHANGYLSPASVMDAEEFFQAKRDEELGRWRWPEDPGFVVYYLREDGLDLVGVLRESDGSQARYDRHDFPTSEADRWLGHRDAAVAYFEAHPERKPWQAAKPGEVWILSTADGENAAYSVMTVREAGTVFESHEGRYSLDDADIEDARRIWPEDAS